MSFSSTAAAPLGSCHYHSPSPLPLSLQGILLQFIQPFIVWQVQFLVPKGVPCALLLALCGDLSSICFALLCSFLFSTLFLFSSSLLLSLTPNSLQLLFSFRPLNFALWCRGCCHKVVQINCDAVERQETNCCCCEAATRNWWGIDLKANT